MEAVDVAETAMIRLGRTSGQAVEGASIKGVYFNGATNVDTIIYPLNVNGIDVSGCHFRSYNTAVFSSGDTLNGRYQANYQDGDVFSDANHAKGWQHDPLAFTIADDAFINFTVPNTYGVIEIYARNGDSYGIATYDLSTPATTKIAGSADFEVTTGALAGTTGSDADLTFSANDGNSRLYIENRLGSSLEIVFNLKENFN